MTSPTATPPVNTAISAVPRGRFVWYDLMTTDIAAAVKFYTAVAKWGTQDFPMGPEPYTMWTAGETPIGGLGKITTEMGPVPPHWLAHVAVPDCDASVKQAQSLGGSVISPAVDIPTVGRFAIIADPQGAVLSLFTPGNPAQPARAPKLGEISWHELVTTDMPAAFEFYTAMFGWERSSEMDMGAMGPYRIFKHEGRDIGGMFTKTPDMPMPPSWCYYIFVDDTDAAAERTKANGGQIINGPMDVPGGGRIAQAIDPQGAVFAVHSMTAS